jgi:nucleotide-binding universal stress UspA family protein
MEGVSTSTGPTLKNILFLTDFSDWSECGIAFAIAFARRHDSNLHVLHVLTSAWSEHLSPPESVAAAVDAAEQDALGEMRRLSSRFAAVPHEMGIVRDKSVWLGVKKILESRAIELMILGARGHAGTIEPSPGCAADGILQRAGISVLTIGPLVKGRHGVGRFHRVLFATDLSPESKAAVRQAVSMVQESESRLLFLHVMPDPNPGGRTTQDSVANVMHQLHELVSYGGNLLYPPRTIVQYGSTEERILEVAQEYGADLIVLGVRAAPDPDAVTHPERITARNVLLRTSCPVLTVPLGEGRDSTQPKPHEDAKGVGGAPQQMARGYIM